MLRSALFYAGLVVLALAAFFQPATWDLVSGEQIPLYDYLMNKSVDELNVWAWESAVSFMFFGAGFTLFALWFLAVIRDLAKYFFASANRHQVVQRGSS